MEDNLDNISGVNEPIYEPSMTTYTLTLNHDGKEITRTYQYDLNHTDFSDENVAEEVSNTIEELLKEIKKETFICSKCNKVKDVSDLKYSGEDSNGNEVNFCNECYKNLPDGDSYRDNLEDR